jgi:hypothetical protein
MFYKRLHLSLTLQPKSGLGCLWVEVSTSHTHTHTHTVRLPWTSDQLVAEGATNTTRHKHKRRKCLPSAGFHHRNRAAADLRLSRLGHQDFIIRSLLATDWKRSDSILDWHRNTLQNINLPSTQLILLCYVGRCVATCINYWWSLSGCQSVSR